MWRSGYLMCPRCGSVYYANHLQPVPNWNRMSYICPNYDCFGFDELFTIDELMIPSVTALNSLGYKTMYCCSGHNRKDAGNGKGYIKFVDLYDFESLPDNWEKEIVDTPRPCLVIRSTTKDLALSISCLERWVENLNPVKKSHKNQTLL